MYCAINQLNKSIESIFLKIDSKFQYCMSSIYQYIWHHIDNEPNEHIANSLRLLSKLCSCYLDLSSKDVFKPLVQLDGKRSFIPSDLTQSEIDYLIEIVDNIDLLVLKARIADILWSYTKPRNIHHLEIAMQQYLAISLSKELFQPDIYDFWHRAAMLAKSSKKQNEIDQIKTKFLQEIDNPTNDWDFHQLKIAEIILQTELDKSLFEQLADKLVLVQRQFSPQNDFNVVEQYLNNAIILYKKAGLTDKEIATIHSLAQAQEMHGDFRQPESNMVANNFYKMALQIYRNIPSKYRTEYQAEASLSRIENKITHSGQTMMNEMQLLEVKKDMSELQKQSIEHIQGKQSLFETLLYFSGVSSTKSYQEILEETKDVIRQSVFQHIMPFQAVSLDGRKIDEIPALNEQNQDEVVFKTAIKNFAIKMQVAVNGCIIPALNQIQNDWIISKDFLIELCRHSSVVPENRVNLLANALYFGFEMDFPTCIHLLAPQVENMVRQLLKKQGVSTTTIDTQGIENEIGLSSLLDKEQAREILGDDLWFELQAVFTSSLNANLRNEVAHGLLDDNSSNSIFSVYAWWLVFKWIIRSIGE